MKRIKYACLEQTIHFQLKDGISSPAAIQAVKEEYQMYRARLDRARTKYKILSEQEQPDGSLIVELKKQYNSYDPGSYLD